MDFRGFGLSCVLATMLTGCATSPPSNPDNICAIFEEKRGWYEAAQKSRDKWGAPVHIPMAIMYQESSFKYDAAPPMEYFLWIIPIGRASDAYGYSQAKTPVWGEYVSEAGGFFSDRDDFDDAVDFIGWYMNRSQKINKVSKWNAYAQYLNYHEGHGGYRRGSYKQKAWLEAVARKVEARAKKYSEQLWTCKDDLKRNWFMRSLF
jgi:hypothetical protein